MEARVRTLAVALLALVAVAGVGLALTGGVGVDGTITLDDSDGPQVEVVTADSEMLLDGDHGGSGTMEIVHEQGTIVFSGPDGTAARVHEDDITGQFTSVTQIDARSGLTITPEDKPGVTVGGGIDSVEFGSMTVDDGTRDFSYSASSGASVTVNEIGATSETVIAVAGDGTVLDQTTADSSGTATFSSLDSGSHDVQIATTSDPELSGASPSGGETVTETPVQLSIDVNDADFDTAQGDTVEVTFIDEDADQTIGTDTLTSNGTAETTFEGSTGGENNWSVEASDEYGNNVQSETFTYNAPDELEIRDEENPSELLTDADVTIEFYAQGDEVDTVVTREATDGTVDMSGLDADREFIAVADAGDFSNRRVFIDSLIETQQIYLLNESSDTVAIEFELEDFSGSFQQSNSVLIVERNIGGEYTPVQGDFFGATGRWEATLSRDTRHRLRIKNLDTGDERVLGSFTPQTDSLQTVTVESDGAIRLSEQFEQIFASPAMGVIPAEENANFGVDIREGDQEIQTWEIEVIHMNPNGTTTTLATREGEGAGKEEFELDLRGLNGSVVAYADITTDERETSVMLSRTIRESHPSADGLLGGMLSIGSGLGVTDESASGASTMLAFLVSVLMTGTVAAKTGSSPEVSGLTALGSLTAFAIIGWLPMNVLFGTAIAFGAMMLLRRGF